MKRLRVSPLALVASLALALAAQAQDRPPQGNPPAERPPAAQPAPGPVPPAIAAAMQRREERSVAIEDLIANVATSTRKVFIVDPRVRAQVFRVPANDNPSYEELLSILRIHGFMAVEIEGRVNIVPDQNARSMPVRMLQRDDNSVPDD